MARRLVEELAELRLERDELVSARTATGHGAEVAELRLELELASARTATGHGTENIAELRTGLEELAAQTKTALEAAAAELRLERDELGSALTATAHGAEAATAELRDFARGFSLELTDALTKGAARGSEVHALRDELATAHAELATARQPAAEECQL